MPYLPVDLDAKRKAEFVDRAFGLSKGATIGGLLDAWEHVWRSKSDTLGELYITGCFGADARVRAGVVEAGFLEQLDDGQWRVKGAKKWLFAMEGRSRGGHAAKANLVPGAIHRQPKGAEDQKGGSSAPAEGQPKASRTPPSAEPSALTANSQQPDLLLSEEDRAAPVEAAGPVQLQEAWNELAHPDLPRWKELGKERQKRAKQRLKERSLETWRQVITRLSASDFCRGTNDRGWCADPDFLLRPETAAKVLEGKYDNRERTTPIPVRALERIERPPPPACARDGCADPGAGMFASAWLCSAHAMEIIHARRQETQP